jgi:hypothetical protein
VLGREQLQWIGQSLVDSGLERQLIEASLPRRLAHGRSASARAIQNCQIRCRRALRCNSAHLLLREDYRGFAGRLTDSPLLQHFCVRDKLHPSSAATLPQYWGCRAEKTGSE